MSQDGAKSSPAQRQSATAGGAPAKDSAAGQERRSEGQRHAGAPAEGEHGLFRQILDDHPLALLAGSLAFGMVAASLLPAALGRKLGSRALGLTAVVADLGASYGSEAWAAAAKGARAGQDRLDDVGETITATSEQARRRAVELGASARRSAAKLAETAAANAWGVRESALRRLNKLSAKARS